MGFPKVTVKKIYAVCEFMNVSFSKLWTHNMNTALIR